MLTELFDNNRICICKFCSSN